MSEKVVLVLLAVEGGAVKEGSGFLSSRRVLNRTVTAYEIKACATNVCAIIVCAIKAGAVKASSGACHQGGNACGCVLLK